MKRFIHIVITALSAVAIAMACQVAAGPASERDWKKEMVQGGNDLASFLKYQPTDGASHSGKVRKAMDPGHVN